ncbi:MAG: AMP-binding protein [Mariprofundaceae bacterium]|nr:AMP-binding protein [Mariprofundaceae bacterium]
MTSTSRLLAAIAQHRRVTPDKIALEGASESLTYSELEREIGQLADDLSEREPDAIGLLMDNSPAWVVADLAAMKTWVPVVPMPLFFSPEQIGHLIISAGLELVLTDQPGPLRRMLGLIGIAISDEDTVDIAGVRVHLFQLEHPATCSIPDSIAKVTYTSGTTGDPKGVCLAQSAMETVAESLQAACHACVDDRHLCALPLATLLENIGGVYVPLLAGGTCILPGLVAVGMRGASGLDPARFLRALIQYEVSTCILIPQMLLALVSAIQSDGKHPASLRYLAVGGAPVSKVLLEAAAQLNLPVFEGYGLSEAASVVAVNGPDEHQPGAVGKPLPHVRLDFADDGEILVSGALFSGYLGQGEPDLQDGYYATGDTGYLDDGGFLHITGRKKHIFITAFGRNVSPEWVERELTAHPGIAQTVIFGEARPFNVAVLSIRDGMNAQAVEQAVAAANARLPDYARVHRWLLADETFSVANGLFTGTGRPMREAIWRQYGERIESLYEDEIL